MKKTIFLFWALCSIYGSMAYGQTSNPVLPPPPPSLAPNAPASVAQTTANNSKPQRASKDGQAVLKSSALMTLNFVNTPVDAVARSFGVMLGKTVMVDPKVNGTITLMSDNPVKPSTALQMFSQATRMRGWALSITDEQIVLTTEGDAKIWPSAIINSRTSDNVGIQSKTTTKDLQKELQRTPAGMITQTIMLDNESPTNMVTILRPLIGPNQTITVAPQANALVITDYAENMERTKKLVASLDTPRARETQVIALKNALADDVVPMLQKILDQVSTGNVQGVNASLIVSDPRSNTIMIRSPSRNMPDIRSFVEQIDNAAAKLNTEHVHVVPLKNADATKLAKTLQTVIAGIPVKELQTGVVYPDVSSNSLLIAAPPSVYQQLARVIAVLDTPRSQIYVESLIAEVNADDAREIGIQWQGPIGKVGDATIGLMGTNFGSGGNNILNLAASAATGALTSTPGTGLNVGAAVQKDGVYFLGFLARFLQESGKGNILSTPNLLTLDNEEAKIVIGQNVPFVTGQYSNSSGSSNNGAVNPFQTIERKDVGLTLKVKPQINEKGNVKLTIFQEVSNVVASSINSAGGLITNKRAIESTVVVENGSIIVLGGLLQDESSNNESKVPGVGDVPVFGRLFKSEQKSSKKTNLMVFLRPVIINGSNDSKAFSVDRYDRMRSSIQALPAYENKAVPSKSTP